MGDAGAILWVVQTVLDLSRVAEAQDSEVSGPVTDVKMPDDATDEPQLLGEVRGPDAPGGIDYKDDIGLLVLAAWGETEGRVIHGW